VELISKLASKDDLIGQLNEKLKKLEEINTDGMKIQDNLKQLKSQLERKLAQAEQKLH
jgi:uncharacterized protein YpuA (DUF1002 family)